MSAFDRMKGWGDLRCGMALTALALTLLTPLFANKSGHFGWGLFPLVLCLVLFWVVIPAVVLTDLVRTLSSRSSEPEVPFEDLRSYFVLMGAWWLGIVLSLFLYNVYGFVSDFFSSFVEP